MQNWEKKKQKNKRKQFRNPCFEREERINSVSSSSLLSSGAEKQKLEHGPEPRYCADHP
jgi:hypothetical protein